MKIIKYLLNIFFVSTLFFTIAHPAARPTQTEEEKKTEALIDPDEIVQAIAKDDHEKAKDLIRSKKFNLNFRNEHIQTVLEIALCKAPFEIVKLLLENGADISSPEYLLITCSIHPSVENTKLLLQHKADVNAQGPLGVSFLAQAAYCNNPNIVKLLLEHGANVNHVDLHGKTALMTACYKGHIDIVKLLLEYGADINLRTNDKKTVLDFANKFYTSADKEDKNTIAKCVNIITLLKNWPLICNFVKAIFDANEKYNINDYKLYPTLLTDKYATEEIFLIVRNKNNGNTLLHDAVIKRDYNLIDYIFHFNPSVIPDLLNLPNNENATPIDLAVTDTHILNYFMDFGDYSKKSDSSKKKKYFIF